MLRLQRCVNPRILSPRFIRFYASGQFGGSEGATAGTKDFGEKERAIENHWARVHDEEKLRAIHDALEKQKKLTDAMKKEVDELKKAVEKQ
ncbi:hypothetical protein BX666DRAFT_2024870 [Dichotomocladium elegans]|nr:hypothetical protein BX666DRAFT_2024870 [Dichotomocladium elegans]